MMSGITKRSAPEGAHLAARTSRLSARLTPEEIMSARPVKPQAMQVTLTTPSPGEVVVPPFPEVSAPVSMDGAIVNRKAAGGERAYLQPPFAQNGVRIRPPEQPTAAEIPASEPAAVQEPEAEEEQDFSASAPVTRSALAALHGKMEFRPMLRGKGPTPPAPLDAETVADMCDAAGFPELITAAVQRPVTKPQLKAALDEAFEIRRVGALLKVPAMAAQAIRMGQPLVVFRHNAFEVGAAADGAIVTDSSHGGGGAAPKPKLDAAAVYARFNASGRRLAG